MAMRYYEVLGVSNHGMRAVLEAARQEAAA